MRRIILAGLLALLAWGGWWQAAATGLGTNIRGWFEDRRAAGWQAELQDVTVGGFPARLRAVLLAPELADPATGLAVGASTLTIDAAAYWPGHVSLLLPEDPVNIASPEGRHLLTASGARADLRLHPGLSLQLDRMALTSGPWGIAGDGGSVVSAASLAMAVQQDGDRPERYRIAADADGLRPGEVPRAALRVPGDWPVAFDRLTLDAAVEFDRPWDRSALEQGRPQPRRIELKLAEASWGRLLIRAAAELDIDAEGFPDGTLSLQARNWRDILALAENAGVLPAGLRPQAENILAALAAGSGNPEALDVTLTFGNGLVSLGFLPLGPAPRLILR